MIELSDKAFNTLTLLKNFTGLNGDDEIQNACREIAEYLEENKTYCHLCGMVEKDHYCTNETCREFGGLK